MEFEPVIGLEIHAELSTRSKMFCACAVVDTTQANPNSSVCPICSGMPGVLPVVNKKAVEYALRVAFALECEIATVSIFARKNYFYPDLPKGYQISQYEEPLAQDGQLWIRSSQGECLIRIRRVHIEEDTGKLVHVTHNGSSYSLVDLNRAGVPLLEIVTEPDLHSADEVRAFAMTLRSILRYLGVNSGDMQKGVLRIEPNVSVRPVGSLDHGTRTEIKNLNSFRALERSVAYEIERQSSLMMQDEDVVQQTLGWDETRQVTFPQRSKEEAHDYRYFPEPDLPPLVINQEWLEQIHAEIPELPTERSKRFQAQYRLNDYDAEVLTNEKAVADFFEQVVSLASDATPKQISNWISGELFNLLNQAGVEILDSLVEPESFAALLKMVVSGEINQNTAKKVLSEMFKTGSSPQQIVEEKGFAQISDMDTITRIVEQVLVEHTSEVEQYKDGNENIANWLFGQIMRAAKGQANPKVIRKVLFEQLDTISQPEED